MNERPSGKLGVKLVALIDQRNKLIGEYDANTRVRQKLQCDLDRLTTKIAELTGLEPAVYGSGGLFDSLKRVRE